MKKIQNSYLTWIGESMRPGFVEEVKAHGFSKRLPGYGMALALSQRDAVVWLVSDDGDYYSCSTCLGDVQCSSCRTFDRKILSWRVEIRSIEDRFVGDEIPSGKRRIIKIRRKRILDARHQKGKCATCNGYRIYKCGTGGWVVTDKGSMDYRSYVWRIRQPGKLDSSVIKSIVKCLDCGGTGKRLRAKVFGFFIPTVEYVLSGKENDIQLEQIEDFRCIDDSTRNPGFYAIARKGARPTVSLLVAVKRLGLSRDRALRDFVSFPPVEIPDLKRFRGFKRRFEPIL